MDDPDRRPASDPMLSLRPGELTLPVNLSDGIERRRRLTYGEVVIRLGLLGHPETIRIQEMPAQLQELLPS